jgi:hypothetical protein
MQYRSRCIICNSFGNALLFRYIYKGRLVEISANIASLFYKEMYMKYLILYYKHYYCRVFFIVLRIHCYSWYTNFRGFRVSYLATKLRIQRIIVTLYMSTLCDVQHILWVQCFGLYVSTVIPPDSVSNIFGEFVFVLYVGIYVSSKMHFSSNHENGYARN